MVLLNVTTSPGERRVGDMAAVLRRGLRGTITEIEILKFRIKSKNFAQNPNDFAEKSDFRMGSYDFVRNHLNLYQNS